MRNSTNIAVERGVLHVVNARSHRLAISSAELLLTPDIAAFLASHVRRGVADARATAARFVDGAAAATMCREVFAHPTRLVTTGAALAHRLYDVSTSVPNVADGTLAVLLCSSDQGPFLSVLKLDPSDAYRAQEVTLPDGSIRIGLELEPDILPSGRERLRKAAFVRPDRDDDHDLLLIDRQRPGSQVSSFFAVAFLGTEPALDAKDRTILLYRELTGAVNEVSGHLDPEGISQLRQYVDGAAAGASVDLDHLVRGLPLTDEDRGRFRARLDEAFPDREFELDQNVVRSFTRARRYIGDHGLTVTVPESFDDDLFEERPHEDDGYWRITITTARWERQ